VKKNACMTRTRANQQSTTNFCVATFAREEKIEKIESPMDGHEIEIREDGNDSRKLKLI